ncbi:hypothetical protein Kfla_4955 [Kribbella flavida DSM 17836]|uniref:Uncharacterized protein n=1 Tax=Kribbella flavida (strain DSM 17836 / JCM 10339 / NBRC 14399) TaxID=479435 RepID=D2Q225_KRIFD|nr:hypothetical protein [Kribbella flavida]ADB33971.1 hypothetical protein Kfla_4955 [Kribbella flavida DSM 17836]
MTLTTTLTTGLALLLAAQALPAPASAAPAAVGSVTIGWADATHELIKITWTETTAAANTLTLHTDDPETAAVRFGTTTADQPNEYLVDPTQLGYTADPRHTSWILVSDGTATTARSVDFDRFHHAQRGAALSFAGDRVRWTAPADTSVDGTPGDPLDLPKAYTYQPMQRVDDDPVGNYECKDTELPATTERTGLVPNPGTAYDLFLTMTNEWGTADVGYLQVGTTQTVTADGPAATAYGATTTIKGHAEGTVMFEQGRPPVCDEVRVDLSNQPLTVQQRTSSTAPWTVVGTVRTTVNGDYTAVVKNPGHRQYRVVRPNTAAFESAWYGGTSGVITVRSLTRVVSAKFIQPVVRLGTRPQAYLWVDPAGTQKAALQFRNAAGAWQGVTYKTLYAGRGLVSFPWNRRGTTRFRWWVPASGGAESVVSPVFTVTVT